MSIIEIIRHKVALSRLWGNTVCRCIALNYVVLDPQFHSIKEQFHESFMVHYHERVWVSPWFALSDPLCKDLLHLIAFSLSRGLQPSISWAIAVSPSIFFLIVSEASFPVPGSLYMSEILRKWELDSSSGPSVVCKWNGLSIWLDLKTFQVWRPCQLAQCSHCSSFLDTGHNVLRI